MHHLSNDFNIDQASQLPFDADFTIRQTQPAPQITRVRRVLSYGQFSR
jgi:hypothetical protein